MKISKTVEHSSISEKLSDTFLMVIDLFCNKYLFLTLLINITIVTKPVLTFISVSSGMYMYYTAETSAVGNRPCRFFGLLSGLFPDKYLFMTVFKAMYFIALLLLSYAMYLLVKKASDYGKKMLFIFGIDVFAALIFHNSERQVLSLTLMYALACSFIALYFLMCGKEKIKWVAAVFAVLAVLVDVRTVYFCVAVPVLILIMKLKKEKFVSVVSILMIVLSLFVFAASSFISNDNKDSEEVKKYFENHYSEKYDRPDNFTDEETEIYHMSNASSTLLPDGFFKVTPVILITEWIPDIADTLLSFTFEDIFQGLCIVYLSLIVVYNHLTVTEEKKHKSNK